MILLIQFFKVTRSHQSNLVQNSTFFFFCINIQHRFCAVHYCHLCLFCLSQNQLSNLSSLHSFQVEELALTNLLRLQKEREMQAKTGTSDPNTQVQL